MNHNSIVQGGKKKEEKKVDSQERKESNRVKNTMM